MPDDARASWELFCLAAQRERVTLRNNIERDHFSVRWDFVNTYLTHAACEDPEQLLHDLIEIEQGLNS